MQILGTGGPGCVAEKAARLAARLTANSGQKKARLDGQTAGLRVLRLNSYRARKKGSVQRDAGYDQLPLGQTVLLGNHLLLRVVGCGKNALSLQAADYTHAYSCGL
jgi:hypothetical protein